MPKPGMGSIFQIKYQWNILVIGNYYVNYQNFQNSMLLSYSDTSRTLMHLFLFTNFAQREPWFQNVRRVYATSINFPCIITLDRTIWTSWNKLLKYNNFKVNINLSSWIWSFQAVIWRRKKQIYSCRESWR